MITSPDAPPELGPDPALALRAAPEEVAAVPAAIRGEEYLLLKWGTLKGWKLENEASIAAFNRYAAEPTAMGAMQQRDTPTQKQAICDLIDAIDGPITNDWSGEDMTKDEAKKYVLEYRS